MKHKSVYFFPKIITLSKTDFLTKNIKQKKFKKRTLAPNLSSWVALLLSVTYRHNVNYACKEHTRIMNKNDWQLTFSLNTVYHWHYFKININRSAISKLPVMSIAIYLMTSLLMEHLEKSNIVLPPSTL